jgi:hypothetical protein
MYRILHLQRAAAVDKVQYKSRLLSKQVSEDEMQVIFAMFAAIFDRMKQWEVQS